jgi:hypothetical protein
VDLALLIRQPGSKEPLLPTMVVEQYRGDATRIAAVEKVLASIVAYGAGAGVPTIPFTRVDRHPASGFVRAIAEGRPGIVVAGWDGKRTRRTGVLSTVLDELLARSREMFVIAHTPRALNVTARIVLVLPRDIARSPGFTEAAEVIKLLTNRLGAALHIVAMGTPDEAVRSRIDAVRPAVATTWQQARTVQSASASLVSDRQPDDLVILLSERRGMLAWRRDLDRSPRHLVRRGIDQFLIVYPSIGEPQRIGVPALAQAIQSRRVAFDVPGESVESALQAILTTGLSEDTGLLRRAVAAATEWASGGALELSSGVAFLGGRIARLTEPMLFLGISTRGVTLPRVVHPARLMLIALCPQDGDGPSRYLAELAPLFTNTERVDAFCRCTDIECVTACFRSDSRPPERTADEVESEELAESDEEPEEHAGASMPGQR